MDKIKREDIVDIAQYEKKRPVFRQDVLELKNKRRIHIGPNITLLLENRQTMIYQIQEMMRVERIVEEDAIQHEIETYNELVPGPGEIKATLLLEFETAEIRDKKLRELLGLENHLFFEVIGQPAVKASFDNRQIATDRISSVQYISFQLGEEHLLGLKTGEPRVKLYSTHPAYSEEYFLQESELEALLADLEG